MSLYNALCPSRVKKFSPLDHPQSSARLAYPLRNFSNTKGIHPSRKITLFSQASISRSSWKGGLTVTYQRRTKGKLLFLSLVSRLFSWTTDSRNLQKPKNCGKFGVAWVIILYNSQHNIYHSKKDNMPLLRSTPSQCLPGLMPYRLAAGAHPLLIQLWLGISCGIINPDSFIFSLLPKSARTGSG